MPKDNPFYYNLPTRPADFVGRWPLVEEIVADLARPRPDSWAVIGGRRFGKSSVLKAIEARLLKRLAHTAPGDWYIFPLVVDLKGSETDTEQNVYARIVRLLYRALHRSPMVSLELHRTRLHTVVNTQLEMLSFYQFEDTLDDLMISFEAHHGPLRLALLLDEVEAITRFDWSETLFNQLRAIIYDGPLADMVKLVLTGAAGVTRVRHEGSPLLNAVKIIHLAALSETDIKILIDRAQVVPEAVRIAVQTQSGGHPFIAQYLLHHLWHDGLAQATPAQVEQVAHQLRRQRAADLQGWWAAIDDSGQFAYAQLINADDWVDEQRLMAQAHHITQPLDQGLAALCYHGLAIRDPNGQRYRAVGSLFRDWFLQHTACARSLGIRNGEQTTSTRSELIEERESLKRQLRQYRKDLLQLQEQKAQYGLNVPLDILNGIDNAQQNIERIEARLKTIKAQLI